MSRYQQAGVGVAQAVEVYRRERFVLGAVNTVPRPAMFCTVLLMEM